MTDAPSRLPEDIVVAHLQTAIDLATANAADGQLPFGAVVLSADHTPIATGVNRQLRDGDPLAHAEVVALRAAGRTHGPTAMADALLVSSCEPCALCIAAAAAAGVARIAYAATRDDVHGIGGAGSPHDLRMRTAADALRRSGTIDLVHVPVAGADAPFGTWARRPRRAR